MERWWCFKNKSTLVGFGSSLPEIDWKKSKSISEMSQNRWSWEGQITGGTNSEAFCFRLFIICFISLHPMLHTWIKEHFVKLAVRKAGVPQSSFETCPTMWKFNIQLGYCSSDINFEIFWSSIALHSLTGIH